MAANDPQPRRVHTLESICRKVEAEVLAELEEHAAALLTHTETQGDLVLARTRKMKAILPEDFMGARVGALAPDIASVGGRLKVLANLQMTMRAGLEATGEAGKEVDQFAIQEKR